MVQQVSFEHIAKGLFFDAETCTCDPCDRQRKAPDAASGPDEQPRAHAQRETEASQLAVWMQVSGTCNLRCTYCYAHHGAYGRTETRMAWRQAKSICDFLLNELQRTYSSLKIVFFGGEPLQSFFLIKEIVAYCRARIAGSAKPLTFAVSTNGTLLDHRKRQFLVENCIEVMVSVDGSREMHDRHRRFEDGTGSYDRTIRNSRLFLEYRDRRTFQASATFARDDFDLVARITALEKEGFLNVKMEPAQLPSSHPLAFRRDDLQAIGDQIDRAARYCRDRAFEGSRVHVEPFAGMLRLLTHGGPRVRRCGAGVNDLAIAIDRRIFPCARLIGRDAWELGDVLRGSDPARQRAWTETAQYTGRVGCGECWARGLCGGGCRVDSIDEMGSMVTPNPLSCAITRRVCEASIWLFDEFKRAGSRAAP